MIITIMIIIMRSIIMIMTSNHMIDILPSMILMLTMMTMMLGPAPSRSRCAASPRWSPEGETRHNSGYNDDIDDIDIDVDDRW